MNQQNTLHFLEAIWQEDNVREIRAFDSKGFITYGYFNSSEKAHSAAQRLLKTHDVYITLNPCNPDLLARSANRLKKASRKDKTTTDRDIQDLKFILIDCDPERPSGISSSNAELKNAEKVIDKIIEVYGTPLIKAMSGNGYHGIYHHNAKDPKQLKAFLETLNMKYSNNGVNIDVKVFNPSRITKVIGTWARKGDNTKERPYRQSYIVSSNKNSVILNIPKTESKQKLQTISINTQTYDNIDFVRNFLNRNSISIKEEKNHDIGKMFLLKNCYFDNSHKNGDASIIVKHNNQIIYQCFHDSCSNHTWNEFKNCLEPPKPFYCKYCNQEIMWSNKNPINLDSTPHTCKKSNASEEKSEVVLPVTSAGVTMKFPIHVLPDTIRQFVVETAKSLSCPVDLVAIPVIVACGVAIGNTRNIRIKKGHLEAAILYASTIAPPGSTKSAAAQKAIKPLEIIDSKLAQNYKEELEQYEQEYEQYNFALADWKEKYKRGEYQEKPEKPVEPIEKAIITSDATTESLGSMMNNNPRGFLLFRDEFSGLVNSFGKYKGGKNDDKEFFLQNWNNSRAKTTRKTQKTIINEKCHICLLGTIQPENIGKLKSSIQDGFIDRILLPFPDETLSYYSDYEIKQKVKDSYYELIERLYKLEFETIDPKTNKFTAKIIDITPEARNIWINYANKTKKEAFDEKLNMNLKTIWGKISSQVARIALIFSQCLEHSQVEEEVMKNAIILGEYFKNHYRKVFWEIETTIEEKIQNAVLSWGKKKGKSIITVRDLVRAGVPGCRNAKQAKELIDHLCENGAVKWNNDRHTQFKILSENDLK